MYTRSNRSLGECVRYVCCCFTVYHIKNVFKRYRMVRCEVLLIGGDIGQRRTCKWNILFYWRELQGAVSQRPINY